MIMVKQILAALLTVVLLAPHGRAESLRPFCTPALAASSTEFGAQAFSLFLIGAQFSRYLKDLRGRWGIFEPAWKAARAPGAGLIYGSPAANDFDDAKRRWDAAEPDSAGEQSAWDAMQ